MRIIIQNQLFKKFFSILPTNIKQRISYILKQISDQSNLKKPDKSGPVMTTVFSMLQQFDCNFMIHGHTHRYRNEMKNGILFFNPGESAGMNSGNNAIGLLDLISLEARRVFF